MNDDVHGRLSRLEDEFDELDSTVTRTDPDNPGAIIRIDRLEQMVQTMVRVGGLVVAAGIAWKVLEVVGQVVAHKISPT